MKLRFWGVSYTEADVISARLKLATTEPGHFIQVTTAEHAAIVAGTASLTQPEPEYCPTCGRRKNKYQSNAERQKAYRERHQGMRY